MKLYQSGGRAAARKHGPDLHNLGFADPEAWPLVEATYREFSRRYLAEYPDARPDPRLGDHLRHAIQGRPQPHFRAGGADHGPQIGSALRRLLGIEGHHLADVKHGGGGWSGDERLGWITTQLLTIFEEEASLHG